MELTLVNGAGGVVRRRAVGQERRALDLLDVVEASDADEAIREHLGAHLDLSDDFFRVGAAVHRELPHDPVTVVIVTSGRPKKSRRVIVAHGGLYIRGNFAPNMGTDTWQ